MVRRVLPSITVCMVLALALFTGLDLSFNIIPNVSSGLIEVDDSGGKDFLTIQEGVNAAIPGDTVFVYAGTYYEDVYINKTINLNGISRDNTTINGTGVNPCITIENVTGTHINGFNLTNGTYGIYLSNSSYNEINDVIIYANTGNGAQISWSSSNNNFTNSVIFSNQGSTGIELGDDSIKNFIFNISVLANFGHGIVIGTTSNDNYIQNCNISLNKRNGISILSSNNTVKDTNVLSNGWGESGWFGIFFGTSDKDNKIINTTLLSNRAYGINFENGAEATLINSTVLNSTDYELYLKGNSKVILLNTSFNKSNVYLDSSSIMRVKWYLHIDVKDYSGNLVSNAKVKIEDNINGTYKETFTTDGNGYVRWITITEYIQQGIEKTYFTSHKIIAWNETLVGYAYPEPFLNKSKTVTIVLHNGTLLDLEPGWNLISLPRSQSDTNLQNVLQSIEGPYDSVQWYNVTDNIDHWKHYHILKPSSLNDLQKLNHTIGFWLHITDIEGTTLVVQGDELTSDQNISLFPGWNLVGYPSKSNKTRDVALDNLFYGSDVDSIWTYNATIQKWIELDDTGDYFEVGQGYWVHSKVTKVWNVPL